MSKRGDKELLTDIAESCRRILYYIKGKSYDGFFKDNKTQDAVVRNLEIIGEAAKNISNELKQKSKKIPWKNIAGTRDRLIHGYFGINYDIVWSIIKKEIPKIVVQINSLTKGLS